jgi:hypothetical protein
LAFFLLTKILVMSSTWFFLVTKWPYFTPKRKNKNGGTPLDISYKL